MMLLAAYNSSSRRQVPPKLFQIVGMRGSFSLLEPKLRGPTIKRGHATCCFPSRRDREREIFSSSLSINHHTMGKRKFLPRYGLVDDGKNTPAFSTYRQVSSRHTHTQHSTHLAAALPFPYLPEFLPAQRLLSTPSSLLFPSSPPPPFFF